MSFTWDIFVFGANAAGTADINRSGLTELNQFASPDGMSFDSRGILWFETDNGETTLTDYTNDQLLAVIPTDLVDASGKVGRTFHEVLIVGLPTAQVRQQLGASLSQAQAVKYYEHTQTTLLRYATLEQAAAAQAQISAALPAATVHLPVRFSQPQLH